MLAANSTFIHLELAHHGGVVAPDFVLSTLQLEGVAEIGQPFEFWDSLQFTVIHLRIHTVTFNSRTAHRRSNEHHHECQTLDVCRVIGE